MSTHRVVGTIASVVVCWLALATALGAWGTGQMDRVLQTIILLTLALGGGAGLFNRAAADGA